METKPINKGTVQNGARRLRRMLKTAGIPLHGKNDRGGVYLSYGLTNCLTIVPYHMTAKTEGEQLMVRVKAVVELAGLTFNVIANSPTAIDIPFESREGGRP